MISSFHYMIEQSKLHNWCWGCWRSLLLQQWLLGLWNGNGGLLFFPLLFDRCQFWSQQNGSWMLRKKKREWEFLDQILNFSRWIEKQFLCYTWFSWPCFARRFAKHKNHMELPEFYYGKGWILFSRTLGPQFSCHSQLNCASVQFYMRVLMHYHHSLILFTSVCSQCHTKKKTYNSRTLLNVLGLLLCILDIWP